MIVVTLKAETMHCDEATQMSAGKVAQALVCFSHDDGDDGSGASLMAGSGILDLDGPRGNFGSFLSILHRGHFPCAFFR